MASEDRYVCFTSTRAQQHLEEWPDGEERDKIIRRIKELEYQPRPEASESISAGRGMRTWTFDPKIERSETVPDENGNLHEYTYPLRVKVRYKVGYNPKRYVVVLTVQSLSDAEEEFYASR